MQQKNRILKNFKINIRMEKVLAGLKFRKNSGELDKNLEIFILKEIQKSYSLIESKAVYRIEDKAVCEYLYSESEAVKRLLKDSEKVVVFAVTVGKKIDEKIEIFLNVAYKKDVMEAAVLDAIGSEAVEQCANYVNDYLKNQVLIKNYLTTKRYSTGYGDWDVKQNFYIAQFLELEDLDLKLNESGFFYPQKTITAIIGLRKRITNNRKLVMSKIK